MSTPTKRPRGAKKTAEPQAAESYDTMVRGLTADDMAALERATERRKATLAATMPGVYLSRNAVLLSLLRTAMAAEDAAAKGGPS